MTKFGMKIPGYVAVAGAANVDIGGTSYNSLVEKDSNPGFIHMSLGGVGRNIAHNLRLLDVGVKMMTAVGDDYNGQTIAASCASLGIDLSASLYVEGGISSTYMFINQPDGEMSVAVNDMRICKQLTPEFFSGKMDIINGAEALVIDANLPGETIEYLAVNSKVPVFADMVSTIKAKNVLPVIDRMFAIKANRLEAEVLSGISIYDEPTLSKAAAVLLEMGVKNVFISLGGDGMFVASEDCMELVESFDTGVVNTTGAGDCAMAALVRSYLAGLSARESAIYANAAAAVTIGSVDTIAKNLSVAAVENIINGAD